MGNAQAVVLTCENETDSTVNIHIKWHEADAPENSNEAKEIGPGSSAVIKGSAANAECNVLYMKSGDTLNFALRQQDCLNDSTIRIQIRDNVAIINGYTRGTVVKKAKHDTTHSSHSQLHSTPQPSQRRLDKEKEKGAPSVRINPALTIATAASVVPPPNIHILDRATILTKYSNNFDEEREFIIANRGST
eukprot:m.248908 g.248908  ORF g.248908 m.248908 type:complete len:191 (-) comp33866_c5_seq5:280-852(-)